MNRNFTQTITVRCSDVDALVVLLAEWDEQQARADITGYAGTRLLADRVTPGVFVIEADFGIVDPDVSAYDEALRNNERSETQEWARRLRELTTAEPEYRHYDEVYRTGF